MKTYTDQQGNKYRKTSGGWEIMRKGIGWQAFESTAWIPVLGDDDEVTRIEPTPQSEPPEVAEEKQVRKVREDELFVHFVDSYQREQLKMFFNEGVSDEFTVDEGNKALAKTSCDYAQAMIDELKKRGRL